MVAMMPEIGHEVRRRREARGWSQAQLAVAAGIGVSAVSLIETAKRNPSATTLAKLASALGVGVADLFPSDQVPLFAASSDSAAVGDPSWFEPADVAHLEPWLRERGLTLLAMSPAEFNQLVASAGVREIPGIVGGLVAEWESLEPIRRESGQSPQATRAVALALSRIAARWQQVAERMRRLPVEAASLASA